MNNTRRLISLNKHFKSFITLRPISGSGQLRNISKHTTSIIKPVSVIKSNVRLQSGDTSSSIDNEEMERFEKWAKAWWVENGEYEALHRMNALRVPLIKDTLVNNLADSQGMASLSEPLTGLNILDIGCGGGILSEPLARLGANVTGIDACSENIISAQLRAETEYKRTDGKANFYERIRYINCTLEDLAEVEDNHEYFDAVVMSEVVEHVNNLDEFLSNSTTLLKNRGYSFVTTINRTNLSYLLAIHAAENIFGLVAKGTHTWEKFVKPEEIQATLEKNNVFVKFKSGMMYNPICQKWSWFDDTSVNYAMYAQKQIH